MSDTVEKIYCTDNNDALLASVMGKNNNDPMAMAAMLNNNQWMNNPFIYLVFLMMFGRNGLWGNNAANLGDLNIVQQLKDCCCQTQQNLLKMGYEQQLATANQTSTIASKICDTNYSLNNAINTLTTGVERGFASTNYATKTQTCEILRDNQRNTQHIIDTLNTHWNQDLQQKYNDARLELSQVRQNQYLISQLKPTTTTTA